MLFKIVINSMSNFRASNETTILIKLSIFELINVNEIFSSFKLSMKSSLFSSCQWNLLFFRVVNEIFSSFELWNALNFRKRKSNKELLIKKFARYRVMNSLHTRQLIYRIRMFVLILNEKRKKFSLSVENDVRKIRCSKMIYRKCKSMIMKKIKKLVVCENMNE
jgi:hypothetical protein